MLNFREFLELDEARLKGLQRHWLQSSSDPNWKIPKYVLNQLRLGNAKALSDMSKKRDSERAWRFLSEPLSTLNLFKKFNWSDTPKIFTVTPIDFDRFTQQRFLYRRFGLKDIGQAHDAKRLQFQLKNKVPAESMEPVLVLETPEGFRLIEGWHRTMALFLGNANSFQRQQLEMSLDDDNHLDLIDLSTWKPITIKAYVGQKY